MLKKLLKALLVVVLSLILFSSGMYYGTRMEHIRIMNGLESICAKEGIISSYWSRGTKITYRCILQNTV